MKVAFIGASSDTKWITYYATSVCSLSSFIGLRTTIRLAANTSKVNFTIPEKTPPGKYLMRFEQFWPSPQFNTTQWYVNCAHINVIGNGGGSFNGYNFAKFPGTYDIMDPGMCVGVILKG